MDSGYTSIYKRARVIVVGCGALGNEVLKDLILSGIGHIVAVDFDHVERHNLTRSILFRESDFSSSCKGRAKVDVVRERLLELRPDLDIQTIHGDIAHDVGLGLLATMNVAIACTDNRLARFMLNRHCMRVGIPWIDGGITLDEGTARVFTPPNTLADHPAGNCYACNLGPEALRDLRYRMPCAGTVRRPTAGDSTPTNITAASVIAAIQVQEALKIISGEGTSLCGRMFYYEGKHLTTRILRFEAYDDDCAEHRHWSPLLPSPFTPDTTVSTVLHTPPCCGDATLHLRDDCFVDYIIDRLTDATYSVMLPGRKVAEAIDRHPLLQGRPLSDFYQHEFRTITADFPYPELSLRQLGIPDNDILRIGEQYITLSK